VPLVELDVEQFSLPIATYARSYFLTARLAARRMVANRSGVIMTVTATPSRTGTPFVGGGTPAMAAVEALTRDLSAELAPQGIRVVGLRPQGIPETGRIRDSFGLYAEASGVTWEQFQESLASRTHTRRLSTLADMANTAVFLASDKASGMTGTVVNLSVGSLDDYSWVGSMSVTDWSSDVGSIRWGSVLQNRGDDGVPVGLIDAVAGSLQQ
jgi:NAD(P)-dependent dehydrogenase (short-subunit alcohol dehydrogenase family)